MLANPIFSSDYAFPLFFLVVLTIYLLVVTKGNVGKMAVNMGDWCVLIFCLFIVLNIIIYNPYKTTFAEILFPVIYFLIYITLRLILGSGGHPKNILFIVFLLVVVEDIVGWLQFFDITRSLNKNFQIMGSFVSPALFTNFIIVAIPGILWLYKNEKHKIGKITYILTIVTSILICFLTDSKLSWLTIAIISFIYFLFLYKNQISVWKKILFFAFSCAIAVVAVLIFFQDSTSGRFFVFKNSLALLGSSFYKGIGIGNFDYYYNLVQADYIRMHPSRYFTNVTYIETAYNEPLQFLIEGGILSFILMLFLVFNVYKYRVYLLKNIEITLGLGSFLIISLFSFPFRTSAVCVLLILYLGIFLSGIKKEKISCKYGKIILGFIVLINTITIIRIAGIESDLMKWRALEQHDVSLSNKQSELIYKDLFKTFGNDKDFLLAFANNRLEYKDFDTAIKLLERASLRSSKLDIFLLLGVNYEKIGNYRKAEENYIKCKYFDPDIVRPRYELMRLYLQQKRLEEAKKTAQDILNTPIKVKSKQAFEIRKYAQKIMDIRSL